MGEAPTTAGHAAIVHAGHRDSFWRHFVEMIAAMVIGMFAGTSIFLIASGMTFDEATAQRPTAILLVMAVSMTIPMVAWMRHRDHSWRNCAEMAGAMVVPVLPFLLLVWFDVTQTALCGAYCALTIPAMFLVMRYRRETYAHH